MRFSFIQLRPFTQKWRAAALADEDLQRLEQQILRKPEAGQVMRGTGGLRKLRFAPAAGGKGKSGSMRVCYAVFPDFGLVFLVTLFEKNVQANLTPGERNSVRALLGRLDHALRKREMP